SRDYFRGAYPDKSFPRLGWALKRCGNRSPWIRHPGFQLQRMPMARCRYVLFSVTLFRPVSRFASQKTGRFTPLTLTNLNMRPLFCDGDAQFLCGGTEISCRFCGQADRPAWLPRPSPRPMRARYQTAPDTEPQS